MGHWVCDLESPLQQRLFMSGFTRTVQGATFVNYMWEGIAPALGNVSQNFDLGPV